MFNNVSEEEKIKIILMNPELIQYIGNPSELVQLAAVYHNGDMIKYIEYPTPNIQLAAVKNKPASIGYVKYRSAKVELFAYLLDQNLKDIVSFSKNHVISNSFYSTDLDLIADFFNKKDVSLPKLTRSIVRHPILATWLELPEDIQFKLIESDLHNIEHIFNPTKDVQIHVITKNSSLLYKITQPCEEAKTLALFS